MKIIYLYIILMFSIVNTKGQDVHFSQFYASPHTLNAALTGLFEGDYRIGINYRNQWASITVPYITSSIYGDLALFKENWRRDRMGIGFVVVQDKSGDGELRLTKLMGSLSYQKGLNNRGTHYISFGLGGGMVQKRVDYTKLFFDNQWDGLKFDPVNLISREVPTNAGSLSYLDFHAGALWFNRLNDDLDIYAGVSAFHLSTPSESFYSSPNVLGLRPVFQGGGRIGVSNQLSLMPSIIYMNQKKAHEFIVGSALTYNLSQDQTGINTYGGIWYRSSDALIFMGGLGYNNLMGAVSYDINTSKLSAASSGRGAVELSLSYIGFLPDIIIIDRTIPCPRM